MSLFGSMMGDFDDDMFMSNPMNMMQMQMRNMNRMMNSLMPDPFNMLMPFDRQQGALMERNNAHQPGMNGLFGFPMGNMNRLLNADIGANPGASYCSSSVISMSSGPDGRPQIYQATTSSKTGPGGVRETRKTVQDSMTGVKKMAIGHHIGDRSHIIEKEQDLRSGQLEERQEFINLDEEEAEDFDREFTNKVGMSGTHVTNGPRGREVLTIEDVGDDEDQPYRRRRHMPALLPAPSSAQSKRSSRTTTTTTTTDITAPAQNATTSTCNSRDLTTTVDNNNVSNYASRRASSSAHHRSHALGVHPRRALRTPISSPLAMSPAPNHHHSVTTPSVLHPHPYKNAVTARRQRIKQHQQQQQQQQKEQLQQVQELQQLQQQQEPAGQEIDDDDDDDDVPQVIIEEPDDDDDDAEQSITANK